MYASKEQLDALETLQDFDRTRIQAELGLKKLPQPAQVEQLRSKLESLAAKIKQIVKLKDEALDSISHIDDEDGRYLLRLKHTQELIDEHRDDYRKVNGLTRELEGYAKRRETLEFERGKAEARLKEVNAVLQQAIEAREQLSAQESELVQSYQQQVVQLKQKAEEALASREQLVGLLPEDVLKDYERILKKCGGIAIAKLDNGTCSACRSAIDPNRLLHMQKEAPLSHCPNCGRIVLVDRP